MTYNNALGVAGANMRQVIKAKRPSAAATSTTHRLLTTLMEERYVHFDGERRLWSVGAPAFVVGSAFLKTRSLAE